MFSLNFHKLLSLCFSEINAVLEAVGLIGIIAAVMCAFSVICSVVHGDTQQLSSAAAQSCGEAVKLALSLAGTMALWGGLMQVADKAGLTRIFARLLSPVTRLLFKDCDEKTMKAVSMNITSNMLGIANAATPPGIAAVKGMYKHGGKYMKRNIAMLTVLNTASVQLIPTTIGTMRASHGSTAPFEVTVPILIVSFVSAFAGCLTVYALSLGRKSDVHR